MNVSPGAWARLVSDTVRRDIKEAIVVPLTRPWWFRLLVVLYIQLRSLIQLVRASR
ncbi:MAG TPA: hypothetical protein VE198_13130 [Actinoallomurus sp.]|jgi:hypothetical protein|nr:hypothetical protein [Actinoallomurus sp.]